MKLDPINEWKAINQSKKYEKIYIFYFFAMRLKANRVKCQIKAAEFNI